MKNVVYASKYLQIEEELHHINGKKVRLPRLLEPDVAVVIPVLGNGSLLLEKQFRAGLKKYVYEFPSGHVEKGETPLVAAKKELKDETGYVARKLSFLMSCYWAPAYSTRKFHFYVAKDLKKVRATNLEDTEDITLLKVSPQDLHKMIQEGKKIVDSKTILGLMLYERSPD